jgi:hypothetical protein
VQRKGVVLKLTSDSPSLSKIEAKGELVVTTVRMCFLPTHPVGAFTGLDIPFSGITGEDFKQPIFGANALEGTVAPVPGRGLDRPARFRLAFNEGGCGTFLHVFFGLIERHRKADEEARRAFFTAPRAVETFIHEQQAYVDPSDPSILFIVQPAAAAVQPTYAAPPPTSAANAGWGPGGGGGQQQPFASAPAYGMAPGMGMAPQAAYYSAGSAAAPSGFQPPAAAAAGYGGMPPPQQQQQGGYYPPAQQQQQQGGYYPAQQGGPNAYPPQPVFGGGGGPTGGGSTLFRGLF